MRVLLILSQIPAAEGSAAGRCAVGLALGLRAHGVDVRILAADPGHPLAHAAEPGLDAEVLPHGARSGWAAHAERWGAPRRHLARGSHLARGTFAARARELARGTDLVHLEEIDAGALVGRLGRPTVCSLHCSTARDRDVRPGRPGWRDGLELLRAERRILSRATHVLTSSPENAADFAARGARDVTWGPLALDPAHYAPSAGLAAPVAGLIGDAAWPVTAAAVRRLVAGVWPRVRARVPGAELRIAGRGMTPEAFGDAPGVRFEGPVASAPEFLGGLGVLLYPAARGSGAKVKVLEALALGIPVVTTACGAEGAARGDGLWIGEDDDALAGAAAVLLDSEQARGVAGRAAAVLFRGGHSPEVATAPVVRLYERMLGGPGGG